MLNNGKSQLLVLKLFFWSYIVHYMRFTFKPLYAEVINSFLYSTKCHGINHIVHTLSCLWSVTGLIGTQHTGIIKVVLHAQQYLIAALYTKIKQAKETSKQTIKY